MLNLSQQFESFSCSQISSDYNIGLRKKRKKKAKKK